MNSAWEAQPERLGVTTFRLLAGTRVAFTTAFALHGLGITTATTAATTATTIGHVVEDTSAIPFS